MFASPLESRFEEILKNDSSCYFIMDPFSEQEIWKAYEVIHNFRNIPLNDVKENLKFAGRIPSMVFSRRTQAVTQIKKALLRKGRYIADEYDREFTPLDDDASHKLVHLKGAREIEFNDVEDFWIASPYVTEKLCVFNSRLLQKLKTQFSSADAHEQHDINFFEGLMKNSAGPQE